MINDLLDKLEEANRIFGAGIASGVQNHADVELCRKQVDDEIKQMQSLIKRLRYDMSLLVNGRAADDAKVKKMQAEIAELKGLLEE